MNQHELIQSVQYWIEKTIIGYNFCPFAKHEFENQRIHYEVVNDTSLEEQLHTLINECQRLDENQSIETTILILPVGLESFFDYLDFLQMANDLLYEQNYEGVYQLASFHPDYCFENAKQNDAENYTNRSPYPLIHILREESLEKALEKYPEPEKIPQRNIEITKNNGQAPFLTILKNSQQITNIKN